MTWHKIETKFKSKNIWHQIKGKLEGYLAQNRNKIRIQFGCLIELYLNCHFNKYSII